MPVWKTLMKEHNDHQPSPKQFGYNLAERIQKFDARNVEFDAMRGQLVIDGNEGVDISEPYDEFMAEERHKRSPIRQ